VSLENIKKRTEEQDSLQGVVEILYECFSHYTWVGIYRLEGDELVLAAWKGPQATQHVRIPLGEGICGSAARTGKTEVVPEVSSDSRYLACFPSTRSEIVVPIKRGGDVLGEIDIDSDLEDAFHDDDRTLLEEVATILAEKWTRTR
jgi:L-methionine (R)-S-oxide reductase